MNTKLVPDALNEILLFNGMVGLTHEIRHRALFHVMMKGALLFVFLYDVLLCAGRIFLNNFVKVIFLRRKILEV